MFAMSDEIPPLPVENIKEKPKCRGRTDNVKTVHPPSNTVCGGYNNKGPD